MLHESLGFDAERSKAISSFVYSLIEAFEGRLDRIIKVLARSGLNGIEISFASYIVGNMVADAQAEGEE